MTKEFNDKSKKCEDILSGYSPEKLKKLYKAYKVNNCEELSKKIAYINMEAFPFGEKCIEYNKKLTEKEIKEKREEIYSKWESKIGKVNKMTGKDLKKLYSDYDEIFFNSDISLLLMDSGYLLSFTTNGENFSTTGICNLKGCKYKIDIPTDKIQNKGHTIVAGHECHNDIECLLRVMEHELSHLLIFIFCGDVVMSDQHGKLFQNFTKNMFGHTEIHHDIF